MKGNSEREPLQLTHKLSNVPLSLRTQSGCVLASASTNESLWESVRDVDISQTSSRTGSPSAGALIRVNPGSSYLDSFAGIKSPTP